jgi:hypothetical protein
MNKDSAITAIDYAIGCLEQIKSKIDDNNAHMFKLTTESNRKLDLVRRMPLQDPVGFEQKGPTVLSIVIEDHSNNGKLLV